MRHLRIDLSNKLTNYGVQLLYRKLFDLHTEYNRAFFSDISTPRKLQIFYSAEDYLESISEEVTIPNNKYLQIDYYYAEFPETVITRLLLMDEDEGKPILDIDDQYLPIHPDEPDSKVVCISCRFVIDRSNTKPKEIKSIRWTPVVLTDFGVRFIYESFANQRNEKINFIYSGNGEPNNSKANCHIVHLLDDINISSIHYFDRFCQLSGRKPFPYNTTSLSELGLGFYHNPRMYCRNYLATMDRNWENKLFPIDRSSQVNADTLEYDHPVLSLRLHDDDYSCVWYSGRYGEEGELDFPNLSFSATFYVNIIYDMLYDEDRLTWEEASNLKGTADALTFEESSYINKTDHFSVLVWGTTNSGISAFGYANIIRVYNDFSFDTSTNRLIDFQTDSSMYVVQNSLSKSAYNNSQDKIFTYTTNLASKNFLNFNTKQITVSLPQSSGSDIIYTEGEDYSLTYSQTEENNVITVTVTVEIPTTSRIVSDLNNSLYYLRIEMLVKQYSIAFTEGVDYTITPGTTTGTINITCIEGGRLYYSYGNVKFVYDRI